MYQILFDDMGKMPDGRHAQRLSPRIRGSRWTELNRLRCRGPERGGLVTEYGGRALKESNG